MKIIGVVLEWNGTERFYGKDSVARMKLAQRGSEQSVLYNGQDLVPDVFVKGHPSTKRFEPLRHSRSHHGLGFTFENR